MRRKVDKLEKIRQIEYDLDRIRSLIERVDERANGVMYASGALALFYVTLLTFITKRDIGLELLVANHSVFVFFLFFSSLCSMVAFVLSIISIYPIPFNVVPSETFSFCWDNVPGKDSERLLRYLRNDHDIGWAENETIKKSDDCKTIRIIKDENPAEIKIDEKRKKAILNINNDRTYNLKVKTKKGKLNIYGRAEGKNGKTTLENFKEGGGKNSKSKILEFGDGTKMEIIFAPTFKFNLKMIGKPNLVESANSCQKMDVDEILYFKCATLHGQKLAVVRKYNWLRWALIVLTVSVVSLFISPLFLIF